MTEKKFSICDCQRRTQPDLHTGSFDNHRTLFALVQGDGSFCQAFVCVHPTSARALTRKNRPHRAPLPAFTLHFVCKTNLPCTPPCPPPCIAPLLLTKSEEEPSPLWGAKRKKGKGRRSRRCCAFSGAPRRKAYAPPRCDDEQQARRKAGKKEKHDKGTVLLSCFALVLF